jgi:hypothetical protein
VAHLDAYAVGKGRRQTRKATPPIKRKNVETFIFWTDGGGTILSLEDEKLKPSSSYQGSAARSHRSELDLSALRAGRPVDPG